MSDAPANDDTNVVVGNFETTLDLPLERILQGARDANLEDALIVGYTSRGSGDPQIGDFYMASQTVDVGKLLIMLERAKALLLRRIDA